MSTTNEALTTTWEKIADDTDYFMAAVALNDPDDADSHSDCEVAFQATDVAPTGVSGYPIVYRRDVVLRTADTSNCPPGFVYARVSPESTAGTLALNVWTA